MSGQSECPISRTEELHLFHFGELTESERRRLEKHLGDCSSCRRELALLRRTLAALPKDAPHFSAGEIRAFNERVSRRLRPGSRPAKVAFGWILAAATTVLLLLSLPWTPSEVQQSSPQVAFEGGSEAERMPEAELLLNMELLENLELLQALEEKGKSG